ncbi:PREDICTED: uncharacterized protein LOC105362473 isoform X1 [Ceratosolen solmsi marchali]|uniref:Uncharacterized protein LOC105362473 isoform X1 n=1 Tax=Ceratosolen solmsi marchali TaxID=326594 RepID=A0AAJ7DVS6_9HYME|nr:PREDICTED: uncharacterized protein LOC105362473 isoform X1 [Ceratosolen solmsi marchali]XP_011498225.1 PREDICTED: uncharacterized protein LOC105362473 isoform X1 [Ceratosolen solmsi marchali]XP_011498226.1 PREDICTED: uncharacterized protein LOC105362473 isoform X1 [Ceratosolen solmsi marchali]XP_011498227.1 PREDICTED: uncharacterized protein LOC105362473 isoform X1 [Ceratosolen solmsi marchali]XP_011498228.1 PREDICTED: uncharacterized protein LOC105362473 isoform X1 [Ceratosolen solmsi march
MPESGAVYQPTTVGYAYDTRDGGRFGIRSNFSRLMSRHKYELKTCLEWVLISVAVATFIIGHGMFLASLLSPDPKPIVQEKESVEVGIPYQYSTVPSKDTTTEIKEHSSYDIDTLTAVGAAMMLFGILLGGIWAWLRFFRRGKSPRGGMISNSGQMLGGLNPSTDLLVGSTSQYGPVLTELPSQLKSKQTNNLEISTAIPLSDQEEETHTLMQDSQQTTGASTITNQLSG